MLLQNLSIKSIPWEKIIAKILDVEVNFLIFNEFLENGSKLILSVGENLKNSPKFEKSTSPAENLLSRCLNSLKNRSLTLTVHAFPSQIYYHSRNLLFQKKKIHKINK